MSITPSFKVLHLCTSDHGGAATAALRLHSGLLREGVDTTFMSHAKERPHIIPRAERFKPRKQQKTIVDKIASRFGVNESAKEFNASLIRGMSGSYETFSFPSTDYRVEDDPLVRNADIIHLHWISFFINYASFFEQVRKPIVWTFHDMNPFMGGFHYGGDLERNPSWSALEAKLAKEKASILSRVKDLTFVTPSKWLGAAAKESAVWRERPYRNIPYGLDTRVFKPADQKFSKALFDIPVDKRIILFVTERIGNYRKGFDMLVTSLRELKLSDDFVIVTIGQPSAEVEGMRGVMSLGRVNDDHLLSVLYSAADLFVMPSREDNFPNVMLESLCCGTPVLGFATGGLMDVVRDGFNGILAAEISARALTASLAAFASGKYTFDRDAIRQDAEAKFGLRVQAQAYMDLYLQIMQSQKSS